MESAFFILSSVVCFRFSDSWHLIMDLWFFEKKATAEGYQEIAGIDEAGRGPLAGPVVSAAVILPKNFSVADVIDSKKLTIKKRARLYEEIYTHAVSVGVGIVDPVEIDRINK